MNLDSCSLVDEVSLALFMDRNLYFGCLTSYSLLTFLALLVKIDFYTALIGHICAYLLTLFP